MPEPKPTLWFVVPCFGRYALTAICLRALRWTCDRLDELGVRADGIVVADDRNFEVARELRFGTVYRENDRLSSRVNDAIAFAGWTRHQKGIAPVDFVTYIGSDNWIDPAWVAAAIPQGDELVCMRSETIVAPDGRRRVELRIGYDGGSGVRVTPVGFLQPLRYRPADERRQRAIDGSSLDRLRNHYGRRGVRMRYVDLHPLQVVGFQSRREQLTTYEVLRADYGVAELDGMGPLRDVYPGELVDAIEQHYAPARRRVPA